MPRRTNMPPHRTKAKTEAAKIRWKSGARGRPASRWTGIGPEIRPKTAVPEIVRAGLMSIHSAANVAEMSRQAHYRLTIRPRTRRAPHNLRWISIADIA